MNEKRREDRSDPELERAQVARVQGLRSRRDGPAAQSALEALGEAAGGSDNLMPHILHAVERECTLGEVADVLREVFGVYEEDPVL